MDIKELKQACDGKWFGILSGLGIKVNETGKHGPCPVCRGSDRFRMDKDGSGYYCNQCVPHAGDTVNLIQKCLGLNFPDVMSRILDMSGGCASTPYSKPKTDPKIALNKTWQSSTDLTGSDPVSRYLRARGLTLTPSNVRFCPECYESDTKKRMPAMIAKIQNIEGRPVSLHRTYLDGDKKADIGSPKKIMTGTGLITGGAVRLFDPSEDLYESDSIGVAEGIETAISCAHLHLIATWACLSTSIMHAWEPPEGIRKIYIFADNDANFAGQKTAYTLANKLFLKDYLVFVMVPEKTGDDWNDVLVRGK